MERSDFRAFFDQLSEAQRAELARSADTTVHYIRHHLIAGRRMPRKRLLDSLADAARAFGGRFTTEQLGAFFLARSQ